MRNTRNVLVVDDDPDIREIVRFVLQERGLTVTEAQDAPTALAMMSERLMDLVVLDIEMPGPSGLDCAKEIRRHSDVPILFLSSRSGSDDRRRGFQTGADDYVTKPFDPEELAARVTAILRRTAPRTLGAPIYDVYCPACVTCVDSDAAACEECGEARPPEGWPAIALSPHEYLGRTVDGRYVLDHFIGAGAMGWVYRARATQIRRFFACKIVDGARFASEDIGEDILRRFQVEVEAMSRLRNPHVVSIYESLMLSDGVCALFMDFVEGRTLQELIDHAGRISVTRSLDLIRQVANGMHEAHEAGIIHRDLKPANIIVERLPASGFFARILDFGIARVVGHATATQGFLGTPLFASPEQCLTEDIDHRSDIYSLGCVLFNCVTGHPPFRGKTHWKVMEAHVHRAAPSIAEALPGVELPTGLNELLAQILSKDPEDRPADMAEVIRLIDQVVDGIIAVEPEEIESTTPRPPQIRTDTRSMTSDVGTRVCNLVLDRGDGGARMGALGEEGRLAVIAGKPGHLHVADLAQSRWRAVLVDVPERLCTLAVDERSGTVFAADESGRIWAWEATDAAPTLVGVTKGRVQAIDATNGGKLVAIGLEDGRVLTLPRAGGVAREIARAASAVRTVALLTGETQVAFGAANGELAVAQLGNAVSKTLTTLSEPIEVMAATRDGYLVAILDGGGTVRIVNTATGQPFFVMSTIGAHLKDLAFANDAQLLGLGIQGTGVTLWRLGPQIQ